MKLAVVAMTIIFPYLAPVWAAVGAAMQTALNGGSIEEIFLATARSAAYSGMVVPVSALAFTAVQMGASAIGGAAARGRASMSVPTGTEASPEDFQIVPAAVDLAGDAMDAGVGGGARSRSETTQPHNYDLHFDGKNLRLYSADGTMAGEWPGVSGRAGYQDPRFQGVADRGPLPEGFYVARQSALQMRPTDAWESIKGFFGRGTWPGGRFSWGDYRIWLDPIRGTDTFSRDGFSIHGGSVPGSAGCIDLCGAMPSFVDAFRATNRDLVLRVRY